MVGGDGEGVGEYQWKARKVAAGVVGHEERRRRGLRGSLGRGGGHGWRRRPFQAERGARSWFSRSGRKERGVRALWSSRDGSRRSWARERASAVGRSDTASPWRFDDGPRRARTGWRRVARLRCFRRTRNGARAGARRVADGAGVRRRTAPARRHGQNRGRRWSEGKTVINSKF